MTCVVECLYTDHLFNSQDSLLHDRANKSVIASAAMLAFLYIFQPKSHSSTPPEAIALQYTVLFRSGWILDKKQQRYMDEILRSQIFQFFQLTSKQNYKKLTLEFY